MTVIQKNAMIDIYSDLLIGNLFHINKQVKQFVYKINPLVKNSNIEILKLIENDCNIWISLIEELNSLLKTSRSDYYKSNK